MGSRNFPPRKRTRSVPIVVWVTLFFLTFFTGGQLFAQETAPAADSTAADSAATVKGMDSIQVPESSSALKSPIYYKATDSIVYDIENKMVYLYGDVEIKYEDINLNSAFVRIDWNTSTLYAEPLPDSTGKMKGYPVFKQGATEIKTQKMAYNFISKKGRVISLITKQDEGFIRGDTVKTVKIDGQNVSYVKNGSYTTCDLAAEQGQEAHFYFRTRRLKLIQNDKVITGPAYMEIEGIPTPLVLPFGFFPANSHKTSGILPPAVGNSATRGYSLRGGGLYVALSKYFDLALTTDIYTGGSYAIYGKSRYARRYRYSGSLDVSIARNQEGYPATPDYKISKDFNFHWTHFQDSKAHPGTTFSADVNFPSPKYFFYTSYNPNEVLNKSANSSIAYSKTFSPSLGRLNLPMSLSLAASNSANLQTHQINMALPNLSYNISRFYPFKPIVGSPWYSAIGMQVNFTAVNSLATTYENLQRDLSLKNFNSGARGSIPIFTNFTVLKYLKVNPTINTNGYFYTKKFTRSDYTKADSVLVRPTQGLFAAGEFNISTAVNTNIYGTYTINRGRLLAVRHVMVPTVNFIYQPDFSKRWMSSYIADSIGNRQVYSYYDNGIAALPTAGKQGKVNLSLENNVEMKVRTSDTSKATKKVTVLQSFGISTSYNFLDTGFYKLSPVLFSVRTTLFKIVGIQAGTRLNPYVLDSLGRNTPHFQWTDQHQLGTFTDANLTLNTSFSHKKGNGTLQPYIQAHPLVGYLYAQPYTDFSAPWSFNIQYSVTYSRFSRSRKLIQSTIFGGDVSLTKNWKIQLASGYDFNQKAFSFTQINITRDLHCWIASLQWVPFGSLRSYLFNIRIKASQLQDLKLQKRKDFYDIQ